jgi:DNA-binding NtrC family response regulator
MSKTTVLVVDDSASPRELARVYIESIGLLVEEARYAKEALEILAKDHERFVAVLTDMEMPPGMHGGDMGREINKLYPDLPVVYMSGLSKTTLVKDGWLAEDAPFLEKPFYSAKEFKEMFRSLAKLASS